MTKQSNSAHKEWIAASLSAPRNDVITSLLNYSIWLQTLDLSLRGMLFMTKQSSGAHKEWIAASLSAPGNDVI